MIVKAGNCMVIEESTNWFIKEIAQTTIGQNQDTLNLDDYTLSYIVVVH